MELVVFVLSRLYAEAVLVPSERLQVRRCRYINATIYISLDRMETSALANIDYEFISSSLIQRSGLYLICHIYD